MNNARFFLLFILLGLFIAPAGVYALTTPEAQEKDTAGIHNDILTIDTHVDTPFQLERSGFNIGETHDVEQDESQVDFPRMKKGGLDAIFFAVFIGQGAMTPDRYKNAHEKALKLFELIHGAIGAHTDLAERALTPEDAYRIEKLGKRAVFIGIENGYALGHDLGNVKKFYDLGARYITLCHTSSNDLCDSSTGEPVNNGLSDFGKSVVAEMNRLGIMVDVSHISDKSLLDVLKLSKTPVIASHSCARALADHPRNLSDDLLKELAKHKGVIQVAMVSDYVKTVPKNPEQQKAFQNIRAKFKNYETMSEEDRKKVHQEWKELNKLYPTPYPTVADFVNHIDHIVKLIGIDYVGIGSDYDGGGELADCKDVGQMGNITAELVKRGYKEEEIRKIWGGNFMRVFREVENAADSKKSPR